MLVSGESFMTSRLAKSAGKSDLDSVRPQAGAGRFMVTLCTLDAPMAIRQPRSPQLQPFTFFVGRAYQADGTERFYLNMGYFNTLADAERWAEKTRRQFPAAFATIASGAPSPIESLEARSSSVSSAAADSRSGDPEAGGLQSLTDTQVMKMLETRRDPVAGPDVPELTLDDVELLRPEDTIVRQVLREAVVQDAPVWFAVQLQWSSQPIELARLRPLPIFRAHTLYATRIRRNGRSRHFLRLGFFADPISAKRVAAQVRSMFDSAAVIPVIEPEITRAREASAANAVPYLEDSRVDLQGDPGDPQRWSISEVSPGATGRRTRSDAAAGDGSVAAPAGRDMWSEPDMLSESGVRHLRVERLEEQSGRWRTIRLHEDAPAEAQFQA
jgi:hypothetical protein